MSAVVAAIRITVTMTVRKLDIAINHGRSVLRGFKSCGVGYMPGFLPTSG
jgi:hypothetical protein